jgi:uncharacterized damage-inducible protein DinB
LAGAALQRRPPSGKWSAHENVAHLARYHEVFRERLQRILNEDRPELGRYRAEEDPGWPPWPAREPAEVQRRLRELRSELIAFVERLSPAELTCTGIHPFFGEMTVPEWIEFFLVHEAHHLYLILLRAHGA